MKMPGSRAGHLPKEAAARPSPVADPGFTKEGEGGPWGACTARAYKHPGSGAEPPAGSRGRAPGGGQWAKLP